MRLRTVLRTAAVIPLALVLLVALIDAVSWRHVERLKTRADLLDRLTAGLFDLNLLGYEYVQNLAPRPNDAWEQKKRELDDLLDLVERLPLRDSKPLETIRQDRPQLDRLFAELVAESSGPSDGAPGRAPATAWESELLAQLLMRSNEMIAAAQGLGVSNREALLAAERMNDLLTALALVVFAVAFPASVWFVARQVNVPLTRLYRGVQVVAAGDLAASLPREGPQEIAAICQAFNDMTASLRENHRLLEQEVADRRQAEQRTRRLNEVLRTIRNINQVVAREKNRDPLLQAVCDALVEARGYQQAWIVVLGPAQQVVAWAQAGSGADLRPHLEGSNSAAACLAAIVARPEVLATEELAPYCGDCPILSGAGGTQPMAVRLEHAGVVYGVMGVVAQRSTELDAEERTLFQEAAGDVAFGLYGLQLEAQRVRSEAAIERARDELESRVRERTAELGAANEDLKQERYLLHSLMDNLPHNIYFKDLQSRFIRINRAMARLFGLAGAAEALGKTDLDFFSDEHALQAMADEQEIVRSGQAVVDKEEKETWPDGHRTWVTSTKMPLYGEAGQIVGTFGISRDITEQKLAGEALHAAKEAAEAASRAKSTFLANMSHEIRTPLNAIIGMTELVLKSALSAQQREFLGTVRDSGEALLTVINDILDFSKIEAGKLLLERSTFNLWESLGDTVKSFALRAHQQDIELACYIHPEVPHVLVGDYSRLRQVIVNLVGNALKFTQRGEVVVEVCREASSSEDLLLHFIISDTGIGIPSDKQVVIFEMFEQADSSMTRRYGGTGLGLAIASRLVDLMGGRIWVESELGRGSRFHFTAHLAPADESEAAPEPLELPGLHGLRVLVVDDNATNRRILDETLRSWQMQPAVAAGADAAIELLRAAQAAGAPFRLVLTDAHMPLVDGFTLAQRIKQDAELRSTVVMMLTSGDRPSDAASCARLGIAAYLLKPIKQSELLETIEMALGIAAAREQAAAVTAPRRAGRLRVLLAEDSLVNQKLAVALLEEQGHQVTVTGNGREALAAMEVQPFDLVLMDVQMPEMDGLEATAAIRRLEHLSGRQTPIVAMTAHALKGDRERCLEAGMDAYIAKPIRPKELFDAIEAVLPSPAAIDEPPPSPVDWAEALEAMQGDHRVLDSVVEAALEEIPLLMTTLREAAAQPDPERLRIAAHTLKASLRLFGAHDAFEQATHLEAMGQQGSLDRVAAVLSVLDPTVARIVAALRDYRPVAHE